jgi:manganese/zinc/iron transport system permease protein
VAAADDHWRLTEPGLHTAAQIVKSHRLWETFLVHQADIATDHVDRDADEIEHVLTPAMLARLEEQLQTDGRWPMPAVPSSVHPLAEPAGAAKSGA